LPSQERNKNTLATQKKGKRMSANTDVKLLDIIQRLIKNSEDEFALIALIDLLKDPSLNHSKAGFQLCLQPKQRPCF